MASSVEINSNRGEEYIQYGSGTCAPQGWKNFDASPTLRLQRLLLVGRVFSVDRLQRKGIVVFPPNVVYGDIVRGLPLAAESCRAIYCSHVLEHLALDDFRSALANTYSYLMEGGIFRFVLPDLERIAREYLDSREENASHAFMDNTCLGRASRSHGLEGRLRDWLGNSSHLWMWDYKSIRVELGRVGFKNIRRAEFGDSKETRYTEVEEKERWINCLGIEAEK